MVRGAERTGRGPVEPARPLGSGFWRCQRRKRACRHRRSARFGAAMTVEQRPEWVCRASARARPPRYGRAHRTASVSANGRRSFEKSLTSIAI